MRLQIRIESRRACLVLCSTLHCANFHLSNNSLLKLPLNVSSSCIRAATVGGGRSGALLQGVHPCHHPGHARQRSHAGVPPPRSRHSSVLLCINTSRTAALLEFCRRLAKGYLLGSVRTSPPSWHQGMIVVAAVARVLKGLTTHVMPAPSCWLPGSRKQSVNWRLGLRRGCCTLR